MTQPNLQPEPGDNPSAFDTADLTALPLMDRGTLEIGQSVTPDYCPPQHLLALLEGRIRLLEIADDGTVYTRALLEPGDLWDKQAWENGDVSWVVSETARLGAMPVSAVKQFPFLVACAERSRQKIHTPAIINPPRTAATLPVEHPRLNHHRSILRDLLSTLKIPSDAPAAEDISDLEALMDRLSDYGIRSQILTMSWPQLQKLPTPWVLEDTEGELHCISSIRHHEIVTRANGRNSTVSVDRRDSRKHWHVLVAQPPRTDAKTIHIPPHEKPFTLGWYAKLLLKNGLVSGQMLVASMMVQVFALGMPIFYMVIFDRVFGRQNLDTLDVIALGMGLVLISDLVVRGLRSLVLTHLLVWVDRMSIDTILELIFKLPLNRMNRDLIRQCGELFHELVKANEAVISLFLLSSLDALFSSVMILVMITLHPKMAFISLMSLIPLTVLTAITSPQVKKRAHQFAKAQRGTQISLSETLENWETLHAYNALPNAKERIGHLSRKMLNSSLWARFDTISGNSLGGFISSMGAMLTLYFGAHEVLQGQISYGAYAAINMMSRNVVGSVQKLFSSFLQFQENASKLEKYQGLSVEILQAMHDAPGEDRPKVVVPALQGAVEIRNMKFHYPADPNKNCVIGPINLNIQPGEKVVLTGPSGSGKTTLIRLLQGLYAPSEGAVTLDGYRLNELEPAIRNRLIGVALQRPAFLSGTLLENLTLEDPDASMKDVLDAIRLAQLDVMIDKLPGGLDYNVAPMAANLPPSLALRLGLARVFINKPSILMIDKALDALEPAIQAAIFSPMLQAYAQSTCVLVTDFLPVHQQADRIIVMKDGMIVEDGSFQSLIQARGYYYHLHVVDKTFSKQA